MCLTEVPIPATATTIEAVSAGLSGRSPSHSRSKRMALIGTRRIGIKAVSTSTTSTVPCFAQVVPIKDRLLQDLELRNHMDTGRVDHCDPYPTHSMVQ